MGTIAIYLYVIGAVISFLIFFVFARFFIVLPGRLKEIERSIDTLNDTMNEIKDVLKEKN